jgi:hypothetical protein
MSPHPPRLRIRRAKVIVDDEGRKIRPTCESCGTDVYLLEGQTSSSEYIPKRDLGDDLPGDSLPTNRALR